MAQESSADLAALVTDLPEGWTPARCWIIFEVSYEAWEEEFPGGLDFDQTRMDPSIDFVTLEELRRMR